MISDHQLFGFTLVFQNLLFLGPIKQLPLVQTPNLPAVAKCVQLLRGLMAVVVHIPCSLVHLSSQATCRNPSFTWGPVWGRTPWNQFSFSLVGILQFVWILCDLFSLVCCAVKVPFPLKPPFKKVMVGLTFGPTPGHYFT